MTIAVGMKINDGLILATDSASTIYGEKENGNKEVYHTYYTADKLFNLKKGSSIGCMTWGDGSIDNVSISTLAKDFRKINNNKEYSEVKTTVKEFKNFLSQKELNNNNIGFLIAGYSKNQEHPEMFIINIKKGVIQDPVEINKNDPLALSWFGFTDFISRFLFGYDEHLKEILQENDIPQKTIDNIVDDCYNNFQLPLGVPAMPIQDAIDLVKFLVEMAINTSRFVPGAQVIGGPIDIAVITKHEGFKWIERKHYFKKELNL